MHNKKIINNTSREVAENSYDPSDYKSSKEIDKGLAITHEQVSDTYMEGTVDGEIDDYKVKSREFPRGNSK